MSATEVRDRLGDRFRLLTGPEYGPDRQLTLQHAVAWSFDLLDDAERSLMGTASVFAGGFDLPALCARRRDDRRGRGAAGCSTRWCASRSVVAHHGADRTRYSLFETIRAFADDQLDETEREALRDRHAAHFGGRGRRPLGAMERARLAGAGGLGARPSWPTCGPRSGGAVDRGQLTVATDVAAHAALMGFSVELFETIGWAEALLDEAAEADVRRLPRLYAAAGYACFVGRAEAATANAHRAVELEARPGYESCEPGYATFIEALGEVYCGNLRSLRRADRRGRGAAGREPRLRRRRLRRRPAVGGPGRRGAGADRGGPGGGARARQPLLGHVHDLDRRAGPVEGGPPARPGDLGRGRGVPRGARRPVLRGVPGPRRRPPAHLRRPARDGPDPVRHRDRDLPARRRGGQLTITLASLPALFERLGRPAAAGTLLGAMARQPAGFHHVPSLSELGGRLRETLGEERADRWAASGAATGPARGGGVRPPPDRRRPLRPRGRAVSGRSRRA